MTGSTTMLRWLAVLLVVILLVIVGAMAWFVLSTSQGPIETPTPDVLPDEFVAVDPTGYVYFTSFNSEMRRPYPAVFSFADRQVSELSNDPSIFYQQVLPIEDGSTYLQAPYVVWPEDVFISSHSEFLHLKSPKINTPDNTVNTQTYLPGALTFSEAANTFAIHGIRGDFLENNDRSDVFNSTYNSQIENWSIFILDENNQFIEVLQEAVSPVWAADGKSLYVLRWDGVYNYELENRLLSKVADLPREEYVSGDAFLVSSARLQLSSAGDALYYTSLSSSQEYDYLFKYDLSNPTSAELSGYWRLPSGTHTAFTLSPDENHAGFVVYNHEQPNSFSFRVLDLNRPHSTEQVPLETMFTVENMTVFHFPYPVWSATVPQSQ